MTWRSTQFTFTDTTTGTVTPCVSSTASGTLRSGSGLSGADAGSLSAVSLGRCVGPLGGPIFIPKAGGLPWHVNLSWYNAAKGVVRGTVSHIRITFRYTDSTGRLTVLTTFGNLHFYDVSDGCLGLFHDGDPATLSATYTVSPKQAITSP